jgi:hypothetical protein
VRKRLSQQTMHSTPVPVQVEMSTRKDSEPTEPGHQPRPTPNCGTPPHARVARPVHIEHNAHLLRSEFRRPMIVAIVKPGASRLRGPLALQPLHPHWRETTARRVAQGRVLAHPLSWSQAVRRKSPRIAPRACIRVFMCVSMT